MKKKYNLDKIKYFIEKEEDKAELTLVSVEGDYIGNAFFYITDNYFIMGHTSSRTKFGDLLYESVAMLANQENKMLCCNREGDLRDPAHEQYSKMFKNPSFDKKYIKEEVLNEQILDFCNEFENPELFHAFSKKTNQWFKESELSASNLSDFMIIKKMKSNILNVCGLDTPYTISYEYDCNKWLDEELPLKIPLLNQNKKSFTKKL